MSKRRGRLRREETARTLQGAKNHPPLLMLMAIDASLFDDDGITLHLGARTDGMRLMEGALKEAKQGKSFRQSFLDMGHELLGTPKIDLKQVIPALLEPSTVSRESMDAFDEEVKAAIRDGRVLILGDVENLILMEMVLTPDGNSIPEGLRVVAGTIPGRYALLCPKVDALRKTVRASVDEFGKAIVLDFGVVGDRVKALDWPDNPSENEGRLQEAVDHLEAHLAAAKDVMWDVFGGYHDGRDE